MMSETANWINEQIFGDLAKEIKQQEERVENLAIRAYISQEEHMRYVEAKRSLHLMKRNLRRLRKDAQPKLF